jgi:hypothetical protein
MLVTAVLPFSHIFIGSLKSVLCQIEVQSFKLIWIVFLSSKLHELLSMDSFIQGYYKWFIPFQNIVFSKVLHIKVSKVKLSL